MSSGPVMLDSQPVHDRRGVDVGVLGAVAHRGDGAGGHGVAGDAVLAVLAGDRLGQTDHAGLGGDVVRPLGHVTGQAVIARDVDQPAPAPLAHARQHVVGEIEGRGEVVVDGRCPIIDGNVLEALTHAAAHIADRDVDRAKLSFGFRHQRAHPLRVGDIRHQPDRPAAGPGDLGHHGVDLAPVAVTVDHHSSALGGEEACNRSADVLARAGDNGDAARETVSHGVLPAGLSPQNSSSSMATTRFSRALISAATPMATASRPSCAVTCTGPRPRAASMKAAIW